MQSYKIYKTIDSCPLWNFAKCLETNDYRYLLILDYYDDLPDGEVEESIYLSILEKYTEGIASSTFNNYINDSFYIIELRKKLVKLSNCAFILCYGIDTNIQNIAEKEINKSINNLSNFEDVKIIESAINSIKSRLDLKIKDYNKKYENKDKKQTDIFEIIDQLQFFNKILINPKEVTVRQFISMVLFMSKNNKENGKRKNRS